MKRGMQKLPFFPTFEDQKGSSCIPSMQSITPGTCRMMLVKLGMQKLQHAANPVKSCCAERWAVVLSVLLLLWLACVLRGPCFFCVGFRAFWRARARDLRAVLFGLLFLRPLARARARPHVSYLVWVPARAQKAGPRHHLGLGWATCIT